MRLCERGHVAVGREPHAAACLGVTDHLLDDPHARAVADDVRVERELAQAALRIGRVELAAKNIEFCGRVSDAELRDLYAKSSALIVPGEEDFGITMVAAMASSVLVLRFR